ncbi:MAG TPA: glycosyl hydrolase 108 family protein [Bacteroidia bacterium]|nr:glycosyl hydrolase 108 family protein [Bacteroidia bacterium]
MADCTQIVPFIKKWEGEYGNDPDDAGGETRKGITYNTWKSVFGDTHDRFMAMSDDDWTAIFKKLFWDRIMGDQINSQSVANLLVDWVWTSGTKTPSKITQQLLIDNFGSTIAADGAFGKLSVAALNAVDQKKLFDLIVQRRFKFLDDIVAARPQNQKFLKGWQNRINDLVAKYGS